MKYWKNTKTLDVYYPSLLDTVGLEEAQLAVIGSKPIDVRSMPNLKGIFKCGVGKDNVPFEDCEELGIKICFPSFKTSNYIFEETANFAVSLIFRMLYYNVGELDSWTKLPRAFLGNRKVLLIGVGNIGKMVASKLERSVGVLKYDVLLNDPSDLPVLMKEADVISLHVPLIDETKGFIDAEKLSWMKDGASLVNTARGLVVDEEALRNEISNGRLNAAFDVYWQEPYNGKLKEFHPDRFLMSPHVASNCEDFLIGLSNDLEQFEKEINHD